MLKNHTEPLPSMLSPLHTVYNNLTTYVGAHAGKPSHLAQTTHHLEFTQCSTHQLKSILKAINLKQNKIRLTALNGDDIQINMDIDGNSLTIKQFYLHNQPQISIQCSDGKNYIKTNLSLDEFAIELNFVLNDRAKNKYAAQAPINELTKNEIDSTIKIIKNNMLGWNAVPLPQGTERKNHIDTQDWMKPQRTVQEQWNTKLKNTWEMLDYVLIYADKRMAFYTYELNAIPVGIMVLDHHYHKDNLYIETLVVHPGSEGGGGSLIEFAVTRSSELGRQGKLCLLPGNEDARQTYLSMGFRNIGDKMLLDPSIESDIWAQTLEGQWKIKKHIDKQYMLNAFDSDLPYQNQNDN